MTRWARGGTANKKKPHEASKWSELKTSQMGESGRVNKHHRKSVPHRKQKAEKETAENVWRKKEERRENRRMNRIESKEKEQVCN
jgi:hypothetical protein